MRKISIFLLLILLCGTAVAQREHRRGRPLTEGFYINVGVVNGPDFSSFIDYVNDFYGTRYLNTSERLDKFGRAPTFSLGYMLRLYPSFALDVGFTIYRLETKGQILNNNPAYPNEPGIRHDLEYQVGMFSVTVPVLLDFSVNQPVVPYAGIGVTIFAMRVDDIRDNGFFTVGSRDTGTSVGGNFEAGVYIKATRKFWIDVKGKWHKGSGSIRAQEPAGYYDKFEIEQDITQFNGGIIYFFR